MFSKSGVSTIDRPSPAAPTGSDGSTGAIGSPASEMDSSAESDGDTEQNWDAEQTRASSRGSRAASPGPASSSSASRRAPRSRRPARDGAVTESCLDLLRRETRGAHEATEALFAPFMTQPAAHLDMFLATHLLAFEAMRDARIGAELSEEAQCLPDMIARLRKDCDLRMLHLPEAPVLPPLPSAAVAYLVIGSRLGTEVIRRKLVAGGSDQPLPCYFAPQDTGPAWQALRARLTALRAASAAAIDICAVARTGFDAFVRADALLRAHPQARPLATQPAAPQLRPTSRIDAPGDRHTHDTKPATQES